MPSLPALSSRQDRERIKVGNVLIPKSLYNLSQSGVKEIKEKAPLENDKIEKSKNKVPSFLTMAQTAVTSVAKWADNGFVSTDETTLKIRTELCKGCEFWNSQHFGGTGRCMKCGCSTWAKIRMATEKCPIGKW